jgi:hypothetical protein
MWRKKYKYSLQDVLLTTDRPTHIQTASYNDVNKAFAELSRLRVKNAAVYNVHQTAEASEQTKNFALMMDVVCNQTE